MAFGLAPGASVPSAFAALMRELGLAATLAELSYSATNVQALTEASRRCHFNLSEPFHPMAREHGEMRGIAAVDLIAARSA